MMKNLFRFKAIETVYNGYRMRSRLEARYAVFFDTLGIKYEYEKEGYDLGGTWYLPDFWLPGENCWVEIKGQEPTEEELNKARTLATCTQKNVCIFYGEVAIPNFSTMERLNSFLIHPASLWTYHTSEHLGGPSTKRVDAPPYLLMLLQQLRNNHITLSLDPEEGLVLIIDETPAYTVDNLDSLIDLLQDQRDILHKAQDILNEKEREIRSFLTSEDGWEVEFLQQTEGMEEDCIWGECETCHTFNIVLYANGGYHLCNDTTVNDLSFDTPRLIAAYTAARQARFEHGKHGSEVR